MLSYLSRTAFWLTVLTLLAFATAPVARAQKVAAGSNFSMALTSTSGGSLYTWGGNVDGQLGQNSSAEYVAGPTTLSGTTWKDLSCGYTFAAAIKTDGSIWAWGNNSNGQLGVDPSSTTTSAVPVQIVTNTQFKSVATGAHHVLALDTSNKLWAWGFNASGQLGIGSVATNKYTPTQVGTSTWSAIASGDFFSLGVRSDGTLWVWGQNVSGIFGNGSAPTLGTMYSTTPVQVGTASDWRSVSAGSGHVLAIKTDGTLWAWGNNQNGALGLGSAITLQYSPARVGSRSDWAMVAAGSNHSVAITTSGQLFVWGSNTLGQLGLGGESNTSPIYTPTQVGASHTWVHAAGHVGHTVAVNNLGEVYAWGNNANGQLGLGDVSTNPIWINTPQQSVIGLNLAISAPTIPAGSIGLGSTQTFSYTVSNVGQANASGGFKVQMYLSTDATLSTTTDRLVDTYTTTTALAKGTSSAISRSITVPSDLTAGDYWVFITVSSNNGIPDADTSNNTQSAKITVVAVDLNVKGLSVPNFGTLGTNIDLVISFDVENLGLAIATGGYSCELILSVDNDINTTNDNTAWGSTITDTNPLAAAGTSHQAVTLQVPTTLAFGNYTLFVRVTPIGLPDNSSVNNVTSAAVSLSGPNLTLPALTFTSTTVAAGANLVGSFDMKNAGSGKVPGNTGILVQYYLSQDTTLTDSDTLLITETYTTAAGGIDPGITVTHNFSVPIPNTVVGGTYQVIVRVNGSQDLKEGSYADNTFTKAIPVTSPNAPGPGLGWGNYTFAADEGVWSSVADDYGTEKTVWRTPALSATKTATLATRVVNAAANTTISFKWKGVTTSALDKMEFYVDGVVQSTISGLTDWQFVSYTLTPGTHTLQWKYTQTTATPGYVLLDLDIPTFLVGGNAAWTIDATGTVAQSPTLSTGQTAYMETTVLGPAEIWFTYKTLTSGSTDNLTFTVNGQTATLQTTTVDATAGTAVFYGTGTALLTSANGTAWTTRTSAVAQSTNALAWNGALLAAVGTRGAIQTSPDGITWTSRTSGVTAHLNAIAWNGAQFAATGAGGTILTSPDGATWTNRSNSAVTTEFTGVAWSPALARYVIVGASGKIYTSTSADGTTWTAQASGITSLLRSVIWDATNAKFVAVGDSGVILTSGDGQTWTAQVSGVTSDLYGAVWDGTRYIVVGYRGTVLTSANAVAWTAQTSGTTETLTSVTHNGAGLIAAVGTAGTVITSPDGVTWTSRTSGSTLVLTGVMWTGTQFVVGGYNGARVGFMLPEGLNAIRWIYTQATTTAGTVWVDDLQVYNPPPTPDMEISGVSYTPGTYILGDSNGTGRLPLTVTATNRGANFNTIPTWLLNDMEVHLSLDRTFGNSDDVALGQFAQVTTTPTGDRVVFSGNLNLPYSTPAGTYFLIVRFKSYEKVTEFTLANNTVVKPNGDFGDIEIKRLPDLLIVPESTLSAEKIYHPEDMTEIRYNIRNTGLGSITPDMPFTSDVKLFARSRNLTGGVDPTSDYLIKTLSSHSETLFLPETGFYGSGYSSVTVRNTVTMPTLRDILVALSAVTDGTPEDEVSVYLNQDVLRNYYFYIVYDADSTNAIQEQSETNRTTMGQLFQIQPTPANISYGTNMPLYGIAHGNDVFVTVGDAGTILYCPNANTSTGNWRNWVRSGINTDPTIRSNITSRTLRAVTYGNGRFVAVGDTGLVAVSTDNGVTWSSYFLAGTPTMFGVTYQSSSNTFIAVGETGSVFTSTDGVTWTARVSGTTNPLVSVACSNTRVVAVGYSGTAVTSSNGGTSWSNGSGVSGYSLSAVAYGNSIFVAANPTLDSSTTVEEFFYSTTGGTLWLGFDAAVSYGLNGMAYGGGKFWAVGLSGGAYYSADGRSNWTSISLPYINSRSLNAVATNSTGSVVIAVGDQGTMVELTRQEIIELWASHYSDTTINDLDADTDSDGLANLLEYALDTNPIVSDNRYQSIQNGISSLIVPPATTAADYLTASFPFNNRCSDLTLKVQRSTDLLTWTDVLQIKPPYTNMLGTSSLTGFNGLRSNPYVVSLVGTGFVAGDNSYFGGTYSASITVRDSQSASGATYLRLTVSSP